MKTIVEAIQAGFLALDRGDARRFFHGRGGVYPGLNYINVDWFDPVLLITLYQQPDDSAWQGFIEQLQGFRSQAASALVQRRYIRGGPISSLWGEPPASAFAREQGLRFELSFGGKQNIGFFLDMAPGRQWLRQRADNKRILNLFAYTCAFSVAAVAGGARTVVNLDMSRAALAVGRENHRLNDHQSRLKRDVQFLSHDLFRSWKKVIAKGPYDVVIIDPPSRQKGSFIAEKDYARVIRRIPALMPAGGEVLACLNAPELGQSFLQQLFDEQCPGARFIGRIANSEDFPEVDEDRSLKMLHYHLPSALMEG